MFVVPVTWKAEVKESLEPRYLRTTRRTQSDSHLKTQRQKLLTIPDKPAEWNVLRNLAETDIKYLVLWLIHRINNWRRD